jgi:hypothetical protein
MRYFKAVIVVVVVVATTTTATKIAHCVKCYAQYEDC